MANASTRSVFVIVEIQSTPGNVRFKFGLTAKETSTFMTSVIRLVSPEVDYELSAWLRTDTLTTQISGIFLRLNTPFNDAIGAATLRSRVQFLDALQYCMETTRDVHIAQICLVRLQDQKLDNKSQLQYGWTT